MDHYIEHHGIKGMKWGVRRYQNADGSLTEAGRRRYDRDNRENAAKKKENRIDIDQPDPKRWVREDLNRTKKVVDSASTTVQYIKSLEREISPTQVQKRLDLSHMSDQELRQLIQREQLEQQYTNLFGSYDKKTINKGRQLVQDILEIGGGTLAITGSALGVALAIKELLG